MESGSAGQIKYLLSHISYLLSAQILSSQRFENSMIACGQGAAQMNIGKGDVESYVLPYSSNVNNILLVAKILHSYDEYIINEQRKLTLLTMQKQYFLAQMFI